MTFTKPAQKGCRSHFLDTFMHRKGRNFKRHKKLTGSNMAYSLSNFRPIAVLSFKPVWFMNINSSEGDN